MSRPRCLRSALAKASSKPLPAARGREFLAVPGPDTLSLLCTSPDGSLSVLNTSRPVSATCPRAAVQRPAHVHVRGSTCVLR